MIKKPQSKVVILVMLLVVIAGIIYALGVLPEKLRIDLDSTAVVAALIVGVVVSLVYTGFVANWLNRGLSLWQRGKKLQRDLDDLKKDPRLQGDR